MTLLGKGLRTQSAPVADTATIQLPVIVAGKKFAKALRRRGRRKVGIVVTYAPVGNAAVSVSINIKPAPGSGKSRIGKVTEILLKGRCGACS